MVKTWQEKFNTANNPKVAVMEKKFAGTKVGERVLITTPAEVNCYVKAIPRGRVRTVKELRTDLAFKYKADTTCPLTTGIFLRIVAECALQELISGKDITKITPFWRVIDPQSTLARKLSCGPQFLQNIREQEAAF